MGAAFGPGGEPPPCTSTIERLIDKPMPIPRAFIVIERLEDPVGTSAFSPGPESRTSTTTPLGPSYYV